MLESTLHPNFVECVAYAKDRGIHEVTTVTNGSMLDLDFFVRAAHAGIDRFTISIDGLHSEYDRIRKPLEFAGMLERLIAIHDYRHSQGWIKPVIKVQGVWPAIRPNPSEYYNTLAPLVDLVSFNPLIDWRHKDTNIEYLDGFSCGTLYQRLVVGADGQVIMCINDENGDVIIGNAHQQSISDIWHGTEMRRLRELHKRHEWHLLYPCTRCLHPRKTEFNEVARVDGRCIQIENYTHRSQVIGD